MPVLSPQSGQAATAGVQGATVDPRLEELHALQAAVPAIVAARYPEVVQMLFETPSLTFQEKKYWFQLLPLMTLEQVQKLKEILVTERQRFIEINQKFSTTKAPSTNPLQQQKIKATQEKIQQQEQVNEKGEKREEEELLNQLHQI